MSSEEQVNVQAKEEDVSHNKKEEKGKDAFIEPQAPPKKVEQQEEAKLRAKYPGLKGPGSSAFLQKRLSKGQKYFDSGDYNMAKAKGQKKNIVIQDKLPGETGDTIPTPEDVHSRKSSLTASKLAAGSLRPLGGGAIPTPDSLPRKPVLAQSKLVNLS